MIRELTSLAVAILLVGAVVFGWISTTHALRVRRVRRMYQSLASATREQLLGSIDMMGRDNFVCTVLAATEPANCDASNCALIESHYGGIPYAEADDKWPQQGPGSSDPADFLIQVFFDDGFPPPWRGRLIVIFNCHEIDQTVRCYSSPSPERFVEMSGGPAPQFEWKLKPVRIPRQPLNDDPDESDVSGSKGRLLDYDPVVLLDVVPELRQNLTRHTDQPADLLAAVLAPNHCGYGFELSDIVQLGGRPVWLQEGLEGLNCDRCGGPMRFLFQFGDLNGGTCLGDSGVCYVFGCDEHPEQPRGIVQVC